MHLDGQPGGWSGQPEPRAHNTATATSASFTPNAVGYWCFASYYSGDADYNTSSDATVDECVNVEGPLTHDHHLAPERHEGHGLLDHVGGPGRHPALPLDPWAPAPGSGAQPYDGRVVRDPARPGTYNVTIHVRDASHPRELVTQSTSR